MATWLAPHDLATSKLTNPMGPTYKCDYRDTRNMFIIF